MNTIADLDITELKTLLQRYNLNVIPVALGENIPGSYWGDPETGIIKNDLYVRNDTPVHSVLHEACHYICMLPEHRKNLHTDTGGDYDEENAVCYLQIILSSFLRNMTFEKMFEDMDTWGYSFRLGSARKWFYEDAEDALAWLLKYQIVDEFNNPTWNLRK